MELTHLSLFSGIGGMDLAAEWAGFETVGQCEFADYPYKVLCKHWPEIHKWRDIHDVTGEEVKRICGEVACVSGGFPCQPHSVAGMRKASTDERDLWPEMRRVIGEVRPRWVVAENVPGLLSSDAGRFFRNILRDFAQMGYDAGWCTYRAADVGAIHGRERVAIVAYANCQRFQGRKNNKSGRKMRARTEQQFSGFLQADFGMDISGLQSYRDDDGVADRVHRTMSMGNMVMPAQFYPVYAAIADIERKESGT